MINKMNEMYNNTNEKVFFAPGDIVTLKQDLENKPMMLVKSVDKATMKEPNGRTMLFGITCMWFTNDKSLQSERFNTKDLMHVE